MRWSVPIVAALLAVGSASPADAADEAASPAEAYLADPANAERVQAIRADLARCLASGPSLDPEALARLESVPGVPFGAFESLLREVPGGAETRTGSFRIPFVVPADGKETYAEVFVPETYDPSRRWPLMVSLHGHACTGEMQCRWYAPWATRIGFLLVAPQAHTEYAGVGWASTEPERSNAIAAVEAVKRLYNVDPDRVILGGCCMGGHGAWEIGMLYADRFCAVFPTIGGPRAINFGYVENLSNLPLFAYIGLDDQPGLVENVHRAADWIRQAGGEVRCKDFPGLGHEVVYAEDPLFFEWWAGRPRNVYPRKVVWHANRPEHRRAYWAEIESFLGVPFDPYTNKTVKMPAGRKLGDDELRQLYAKSIREKTPGFTAELRPGNRIEVSARGLDRMTFYLSDRMLDLDRAVEIVVNGKTRSSEKPKRSLRTMLEHAAASHDTGRVFSARVSVSARG